MASGVLAGASRPYQIVASKPGIASASAGSPGVSSFRFGEVTPMPRSVPPCICGIATEKSPKVRSITPALTSGMAGGTARDFLRAEAAECAGPILDQHGLAERVLQMLAEQARDIVRAGARGKRHDDLDLPSRVVVVGRKGARHRNSQQHERGEKAQ